MRLRNLPKKQSNLQINPRKRNKIVFILLWMTSLFAYVPESKVGEQNDLPPAIEGVGIDEKLNQRLPRGLIFTDEQGNQINLSDFYNNKKPLVLSPVYYSCPSLCNLHLKGVFEVFDQLGLKPGEDFEFIALSIDPKEKPPLARNKKKAYISNFLKGKEGIAKGIHFLTGSHENIKKITQSLGFKYRWNEELKEWSHASAAVLTTPGGLISRYLHGVYFDSKVFRLSVVEASKGLVGDMKDNFALFCFRYNSKTGQYSFYVLNVLKALSLLFLIVLFLWLIPFWLKSKKEIIE